MYHLRMTCLRCNQEGMTTQLVPSFQHRHWAFCPVHSPEWVANEQQQARTRNILANPPLEKGKPSRPGG